jgi:hypothetical protein
MELEPVMCGHCGAPLDVPEDVRFVTCKKCESRLAVRRDDTAVYTELLGDMAEAAARTADHVAALRTQAKIERLDREWERRREEQHPHRGGARQVVRTYALSAGLVGVLFAVPVFIDFRRFESWLPIALGTIGLAAGIAIVGDRWAMPLDRKYRLALRDYEEKRAALLAELAGEGEEAPQRRSPSEDCQRQWRSCRRPGVVKSRALLHWVKHAPPEGGSFGRVQTGSSNPSKHAPTPTASPKGPQEPPLQSPSSQQIRAHRNGEPTHTVPFGHARALPPHSSHSASRGSFAAKQPQVPTVTPVSEQISLSASQGAPVTGLHGLLSLQVPLA